jgi:hypothetical protein
MNGDEFKSTLRRKEREKGKGKGKREKDTQIVHTKQKMHS